MRTKKRSRDVVPAASGKTGCSGKRAMARNNLCRCENGKGKSERKRLTGADRQRNTRASQLRDVSGESQRETADGHGELSSAFNISGRSVGNGGKQKGGRKTERGKHTRYAGEGCSLPAATENLGTAAAGPPLQRKRTDESGDAAE